MGFLDDVIEEKKAEVASRRKVLPAGALAPHPATGRYGFLESLTRDGIRLICEVKRKSPTRPDLAPDDDIISRVHAYQKGGAAAISVLTDEPHFGGSLDDLAQIRDEVSLPLLRKDFVVDPYQILEAGNVGANAVLLIVAALEGSQLQELVAFTIDQGLEPLLEVHDEAELERALTVGARVIGINSRNLRTLEVDPEVTKRLLPEIPDDIAAIAESGIRSHEDIHEFRQLGAQGFLIGTLLMESEDVLGTLKQLHGLLF